MADDVKRVRMVVPDDHPGVHDGLGGVHKAGDTPVLPADVAQILIEKNLAVAFGDDGETAAEQRRALDREITAREAEAYAAGARARMVVHDQMTEAERKALAGKENLTTFTAAQIEHGIAAGLYTKEQLDADVKKYLAAQDAAPARKRGRKQ